MIIEYTSASKRIASIKKWSIELDSWRIGSKEREKWSWQSWIQYWITRQAELTLIINMIIQVYFFKAK